MFDQVRRPAFLVACPRSVLHQSIVVSSLHKCWFLELEARPIEEKHSLNRLSFCHAILQVAVRLPVDVQRVQGVHRQHVFRDGFEVGQQVAWVCGDDEVCKECDECKFAADRGYL